MNVLPNHEPLQDLLVLHATQGLSDAELAEFKSLLQAHPELTGDELEAAAAAILLAGSGAQPALPAHLADKILAAAPVNKFNNPANNAANVVALPVKRRASEVAAWWSAAACLVLAISGWWPRLTERPATQVVLSAEQQRAALLNSGHAIQASWSPGAAADTPLLGDVVFDPVTQRGYLRFKGIRANDPRLEQYQLWIADAARTPPEPVDGGVFNTPQSTNDGDVIIPFAAKLPVGKPAAFVVTVEQPGGVVVSKQERVVALAKVSS